MQTQLEVEFQGMGEAPEIRSAIVRHIGELEGRFGRVTACRVVLKAPGGHHRAGGLFEIGIHLVLPGGRVVDVGHTPRQDERYSDLTFALNDAFKRARRKLQDQVRVMQGNVKQHDAQPVGTVTRIDDSGEFGFLETADGREIYFHRNSVLNGGFAQLAAGSRVAFAEEPGEKGPQASTVKLLGKHKLRA